MAEMRFGFKEFRVYKEGEEYCLFGRNALKDHILYNDRGLADQINRTLNSILLNFAEGSADNSDKEFARFLGISIRSVYETVAGFDMAALYEFIDDSLNNQIEEKAHGLVKQLVLFRTKLRS
jgi:four helix bundle protein